MDKQIIAVQGLDWRQEIDGCTMTLVHKCGEALHFTHRALPESVSEAKREHELRCPEQNMSWAAACWPDGQDPQEE